LHEGRKLGRAVGRPFREIADDAAGGNDFDFVARLDPVDGFG